MDQPLTNCRYCADIAKANGVDPLGTAAKTDHWLITEMKQPWSRSLVEHPQVKPLIPLFKKLIFRRGILIRPIAIATNHDYSQTGWTRVLYYHRPSSQFAQYAKQEFLIPETEGLNFTMALLKSLLKQPNNLKHYHQYQQDTTDIRELLVCTHTQVDLACGRYGTPIYRQLKRDYGHHPQSLRVWQATHFGGHQFAPTLLDLPTGQFWGHLDPAILPTLIERQGDVSSLRPYYRGWSGLQKFEQMAEGEIWKREGWAWLDYPKSGRTTQKGLKGIKQFLYPLLRLIPFQLLQMWLEQWTQEADWVEVHLQFTLPKTTQISRYRVRLAAKGRVKTAVKSAAKANESMPLQEQWQYEVTQVVQCDP